MKPERKLRRAKSRSRSTFNSQGDAAKIVQGLTVLRDAVEAEIAELETERAEHRKKIAILRAAEMAGPRKRRVYFRLARLMLDGVGSDTVASHLARLKPEVLRKIANALEATEKDVDRAGLRVVKAYSAAMHSLGRLPTLPEIQDQYRKLYPKLRVPQRKSIARTLRRKELAWQHGKPGAPKKNG
jgi:hypothetical protein